MRINLLDEKDSLCRYKDPCADMNQCLNVGVKITETQIIYVFTEGDSALIRDPVGTHLQKYFQTCFMPSPYGENRAIQGHNYLLVRWMLFGMDVCKEELCALI